MNTVGQIYVYGEIAQRSLPRSDRSAGPAGGHRAGIPATGIRATGTPATDISGAGHPAPELRGITPTGGSSGGHSP